MDVVGCLRLGCLAGTVVFFLASGCEASTCCCRFCRFCRFQRALAEWASLAIRREMFCGHEPRLTAGGGSSAFRRCRTKRLPFHTYSLPNGAKQSHQTKTKTKIGSFPLTVSIGGPGLAPDTRKAGPSQILQEPRASGRQKHPLWWSCCSSRSTLGPGCGPATREAVQTLSSCKKRRKERA